MALADLLQQLATANQQAPPAAPPVVVRKRAPAPVAPVAAPVDDTPPPDAEPGSPQDILNTIDALHAGKLNKFEAASKLSQTFQQKQNDLSKAQNTLKNVKDPYMSPEQYAQNVDLITSNPLPGASLARSASQGVQDAISNIQAMPRDGINYQAIASGLNALNKGLGPGDLDVGAFSKGETAEQRQQLLAQLNEKLADNADKQSHFETSLFSDLQRKNPDIATAQYLAQNARDNTTGNQNVLTQGAAQVPIKPAGSGQSPDFYRQIEDYKKAQGGPEKVAQALAQIDKLVPGGIAGWSGQNIPGAGAGGGLTAYIPGPGFADRQAMRQAVQNMLLPLMHENFGARQTDMERAMQKLSTGTGALNTDAQFIQGLREVAQTNQQAMRDNEITMGAGKGGPAATHYMQTNPGFIKSSDVPTYGGGGAAHGTLPQAPTANGGTNLLQQLRGMGK